MNFLSWAVLAAVIAGAVFALLYVVRNKGGCSGCSGNCSECGSCGNGSCSHKKQGGK